MLLDDSTLYSRMYTVQLLYDGLYGVAELAGHVEAAAPLQPVHTVQQQAL